MGRTSLAEYLRRRAAKGGATPTATSVTSDYQAALERMQTPATSGVQGFGAPPGALDNYRPIQPLPTNTYDFSIGGAAPSSLAFPSAAAGGDWRSSLSPAESWIIQRESSFNPLAKNPTSSAFGIWQGLDSTRRAYGAKVGVNPNTTDPAEQLLMFRRYIADRYGSADAAQRFWQANHWY